MMNNKKKLVYILPNFDLETDTHYFYLYGFIKKIAESFDLTLLIEKNNSDIGFFDNIKNIKVQKFDKGLLRVVENFFLILFLRLKGNKDFYIHYSQISAFNSSVISRLSGGRTFYWNCGMMWLFGKKKFLKIILKMITHLVTGVDVLADGYAKNYNLKRSKIKIMPNWIDLKRFENIEIDSILEKYKLSKDGKYVLFVHRLAKRKGAHHIKQIANAFQGQKDTVFLIAGDGPYKKQLEQEIISLKNVTLLGKVPNKDIPSLMKVSKLFFMPSEEEGFPRVLLEAMAASLPYVAFDIGGVREISSTEQQEYIVSDVDSMNVAIKNILNNQDVHNKLKQRNLEHVKQFDIKVVKNRFAELFFRSI